MAETLYILFEHASGYGLFHIREFGEVMDEKNLADAVADLSKFNSVVKLVAFAPFKSGQNALDNLNAISEGLLHEDLRTVLEANLPKGGKKQKVMLGVGDSRIRDVIQEDLGIPCRTSGNIPDLLRGIRYHIHHFVSGLTEVSSQKAQLGLGHCYSRAKVKFNVNRVDNMIIQSICLLDQLDKDINTFSMRVREWYSYHFPELIKIVSDNHMFARMVNLIGDRKTLTGDHQELLTEIIGDEAKSAAVIAAARASMGMDISEVDLLNIKEFSKRVVSLTDFRKSLSDYLRDKMDQVAPNLSTLIGEQVGARLISHAGSLTNLAKNPASTVQILGAEKALFRALKTRGNTPKYGLIYHSTFIGRANASDKGRISRYLANKCSIASRIDCFSEHPTSVFGEKLRDQVEERLAFLGGGATPAKNIDVMKAAVAEAAAVLAEQKLLDKKRKKKKKRDADEMNDTVENGEDGETEEPPKKKKKKKDKKKDKENGDASMDTSGLADTTVEEETPGKKKKKKKKGKENGDDTLEDSALAEASMDVDDTPAKKQKKKKKDRGSE